MPVKHLPAHPDLTHLKHQAKDILSGLAVQDPSVAQRIREFHPRFRSAADAEIFGSAMTLSDAQLTIAREYGFRSWPRLKAHVDDPALADRLRLPHHERIDDAIFRHALGLLDAGDVDGLRSHLRAHPSLVHQHVVFEGGNYFYDATLLEFIAENPVRHGTLPPNIVELTQVILDAGVEGAALNQTLMLVATGSVPRECRVQLPLIDLLCSNGADATNAVRVAALHSELESVQALIRRGARVDLPIAAALGRLEKFSQLLREASKEDRHLALALASQYGCVEIVRLLLDAGEDPNRYHPVGGHSHTTPLHQAAFEGNAQLVRLLVERGARVDIKDILWQGTPADWAEHAGHREIESYLRDHEKRVENPT